MIKKYAMHLIWLLAIIALSTVTLLLTVPSWSSPAALFVTTSAPETLPLTAETNIILSGGGFSPATTLWLFPENSVRTATTATLETYGNPQHFVERDDHLYVANGVGGFFIVQGVRSATPSISGVLNRGGQGMEIVLHQNAAIVAAGNSGLQVIDIRDDSNPQLLALLTSVTPALSVASSGEIGYVATGKSGVQIVDLSDPHNPRGLGKMANLSEAYKVICDEELLIVSTGRGGEIYDIHQPKKPRRLTHLPVTGWSNTVMTRYGETLYWATKTLQESRLFSIDLSRPEAPRIVDNFPLSSTPMGISCDNDHVAIALGSGGVEIFERAGESRLSPLYTIDAKSRARFALPLGSDLWVGDGGGELLRIDKEKAAALHTTPTLPDFSSQIPPLVTSQLIILGNKAGLAVHARWLDTTPTLLARLAITGLRQQYLAADQNRLWLAARNIEPLTGGKLIGADISTPHAPRIMAEILLPSPPVIVGEIGTTLVVATPSLDKTSYSGNQLFSNPNIDSLHFIDTSLPEAPALFLKYPLGSSCSGVTLTGSVLALMQTDGLFRLIDLSDKLIPKELGSLQMPWLQGAAWSAGRASIFIKDKIAFISSHLGEITVISMRNPRQPKIIGGFKLGGPILSLLSSDHFLFAETKKVGLTVIDITDPLAPALLGTIPLPGHDHNWVAQGESLWHVSVDNKGLYSLPMPRRLQNLTADSRQFVASLGQLPPPGAYRLWLTDAQNQILLPGVSWIHRGEQRR